MEKFVSTEVEGFQVYRAVDSKAQHSYTVKRFMITGYDPRCMLVNELDGNPPHPKIGSGFMRKAILWECFALFQSLPRSEGSSGIEYHYFS